MNSIERGNDLVYVDYSDLLHKILHIIKKRSELFKVSPDGNRLRIDINSVATDIAVLQVNNPLSVSVNSAKAATVNFSLGFKEQFATQIKAITDSLQQLLESTLSEQQPPTSIQEFVKKLVKDLETFKSESSGLNFTYPFPSHQALEKQRLTFLDKSVKSQQFLRFHKLTITVKKTREFNHQLHQSLENYIKVQFAGASEEEREELGYILEDLYKERENSESDFYRLKRIIDQETLGKLKKQAQINSLEFLYENTNTDTSKANAEAAIYLQDIIRRLKLIEEYINDGTKAEGYYLVNYGGVSLNYQDVFSRSEAFEMLPIIPIIEGYLGETKDDKKGEIQFIFGVKLKFDGKVQAYGGKTVFEHYLNLLNPDSEEHQAQLTNPLKKETFVYKVLKIVFLYYILFAIRPNISAQGCNQDLELTYNPISAFDEKVMVILRGDDDAAKQNLFRNIIKGFEKYNIKNKIKKLKILLTKLIKQKTILHTREYPLHISISNRILEDKIDPIINRSTFFNQSLRGNPKEVLKYISVGEAIAKTNSLCTLPAKIIISDIHYVSTSERQTFGIEYDITSIKVLPLLFRPLQNKNCEIYQKNFQHSNLVLFPYRLEDNKLEPQQAFIYQFTFSLLVYICTRILLHNQERLFLPILRLHLHNKEDDAPVEKFIVSLSEILSHLLNEEHCANAQGIDIRDTEKLKYKIPNVLSSLYSVIPKKFTFSNTSESPQVVDKLAMMIVSSRESDRIRGSRQKLSNLMGEIFVLCRQESAVRIELLNTFSDNCEHQQMFNHPTVIIDEVAKLYQRGYKHILYIAKAPYTSTLYMTQTEDDDRLFFLSREVIKALKAQHKDIKIYPIFFDKYYAVKLLQIGVNSLYIQDTVELTNLVDDPSQKSVVFFNLFNGITVGKQEERHYNGVISYATLLKIYEGILDDENIYKGLIFKGVEKNDILQYLTLFHFSRYEKAKDIHLKLDPYENLIGDKSVGALSSFNHMRGKAVFNCLAFLTEVKKILNAC
jgi:Asp-tRNA(Asn)/Glu-tRNA(Gln) amidotransferase C subunit